jgi:serine phosphatase RsbU (regulator of sigma subunit)
VRLKKTFILLVFCCASAFAFSQQQRFIDSVLQIIIKSDIDTVKGWNYVLLSSKTVNGNPFIAKYYAVKAREIFEKTSHKAGVVMSCLKITEACRLMNDESTMLDNVRFALSIAERLNEPHLMASCFQEMALISNTQNDLDKALAYNTKALDIWLKLKNDNEVSSIYNNIGIQYSKKGDWSNGLKYFRMAVMHEEKRKNHPAMGNAYNNIGIYYTAKGQYDSAFYFLTKGRKLRAESNNKLGIAGSCNNLALLYMHLDKPKIALKYADTSLQIAKEINNYVQEDEVLQTYYSIYERMGDYKMALKYFTKHEKLRNKMDNESNNRKLSEIQSNIELEMKEKEILKKDLEIKTGYAEGRKRTLALLLSLGVLVFAGFFIWYILKVNKKVKSANAIITKQKKQTEIQKKIIEEKHKDIIDSIYYAQKIQESLIIPEIQLLKSIPESFILYRPRDIVSGDFYWFAEKDGVKILAVADCTGHGIPGAFMSLIGISSLNQIVIEKGITSPARILDLLREQVIRSFNQTDEESHRRDGMDIGIVKISEGRVTFAGANNPCLLLRGNEIISYSPDKQPVGFHEHATSFNEQTILTQKGDTFYLFSDGIVDQFGGPKGKKLKIKYFKEWILENAHLPMQEQKKIIEQNLVQWKRGFDQTDDILVAGIKC